MHVSIGCIWLRMWYSGEPL